MQIYRGMDIGTAKPPSEFLQRIPHHLIDIRDPDERYDVGAFVDDANAAIDDILSRGRLPVVSGGTGFYFKHLLLGLPEAPRCDPEIRARIQEEVERVGLAGIGERLRRVDPTSAERIAPNDGYRIMRALEVFDQTGRPLSSFAMSGPPRTDLAVTSVALGRERTELRERIGVRVAAMFDAGLRDEVERLAAAGYGSHAPGMRAIGYREFFREDGALRPRRDDASIAGEIGVSSRRYAKRQETFFRRLPDVVEVAARQVDAVIALVDEVLRELDSS
jgi:tRNA dimethylallyltransferase